MGKKHKIDCGRGYCRERLASPKLFAKGSLRTITQGGIKIVIGCPVGHWNSKTHRCRVGTRAQTILRPIGHPRCRKCRR